MSLSYNPFNQQPHSSSYNELLRKRLQLPVFTQLRKFCNKFSKHQCIIVTGETGCGKTTQIPQFVAYGDLPHARGKIVAVTQPRRVTTVSVASRVASEMDVELGKEVGYSIRFDDKTTAGTTFLRYMTDGKLLYEAMYDPDFNRYSTIIIDEAHERTIATDILMAMLKSVAKKRPDLKIIIMSATLDAPMFRQYFSLDGVTPASLLHVAGRSYEVTRLYIKETPLDYVAKSIEVVLKIHKDDNPGDILVFLTGEEEVERVCKQITHTVNSIRKNDPKVGPLDCIPLYSLLPPDKQQRIFDPPPKNQVPDGRPGRKVIVATNIAETSLTIDGIYFVVDCGYSKQRVFNPKLRMDFLRVRRISRASAEQRAGRAGRTGPGKCYRLYTEEEFGDMAEKTRPEVMNINLSDAMLKMLTMGIKANDLLNYDFIDAPSGERIACALKMLAELGALDAENQLTEMGRMMAEFPMDPQLSKALIASVRLKSAEQMLTIASMLSVQSVWRRPYGEYAQAEKAKAKFVDKGGDHLTLWHVYTQYINHSCDEEWAKKNYLSVNSLEEARKVREQLAEMLKKRYEVQESKNDLSGDVVKALACGYYMQVAFRNSNGKYVRVKDNVVCLFLFKNIVTDETAKTRRSGYILSAGC
ncbi:hypothetical protein AX15_006397 [Amanita polypyramis BW_CC]|nr:hypothetical protein AX15_006397 [Amanita polypyramis BW_CC]